MNKADIARQYREKYPDMPTAKLARIMYNKESVLFKDVESARSRLRYIEGKSGYRMRNNVKDSPLIMNEARKLNPYKLPESDEVDYRPYVIKNSKRIFLLNDVHIPYHNNEAITAAIKYAKKEKPDSVLLNGDIMDFYGLSRFGRDPRKRNFAQELDTFKKFIQVLQKQFPGAKMIYKLGNHEERYLHYLWMKSGELVGVDEFELENIIKARANGITIVGDKRIIRANHLPVIHGHEYTQGVFNPVNVARGLFLRAKSSAIQGHNHSSSEHTERDINNKIVTTWSVGCLCELHPAYAPLNRWNHGFALIDLDSNGKNFEVRNKRILKGTVL